MNEFTMRDLEGDEIRVRQFSRAQLGITIAEGRNETCVLLEEYQAEALRDRLNELYPKGER